MAETEIYTEQRDLSEHVGVKDQFAASNPWMEDVKGNLIILYLKFKLSK